MQNYLIGQCFLSLEYFNLWKFEYHPIYNWSLMHWSLFSKAHCWMTEWKVIVLLALVGVNLKYKHLLIGGEGVWSTMFRCLFNWTNQFRSTINSPNVKSLLCVWFRWVLEVVENSLILAVLFFSVNGLPTLMCLFLQQF